MRDNPQQALANLMRYGTVDSVDVDARRVRVRSGELLTKPLPWITGRAGDVSVWCPPSVGEQVLLLSPCGEPAAGVVLPAIFSTTNPAPGGAKAGLAIVLFADGARVAYDQPAHHLTVSLPSGGAIEVTAPGGVTVNTDGTATVNASQGVTIKGDTTIHGNLSVSGTAHADGDITSDADVKAGSISLQHHKTPNVQPGSGLSGEPV